MFFELLTGLFLPLVILSFLYLQMALSFEFVQIQLCLILKNLRHWCPVLNLSADKGKKDLKNAQIYISTHKHESLFCRLNHIPCSSSDLKDLQILYLDRTLVTDACSEVIKCKYRLEILGCFHIQSIFYFRL